LAYPRTRETKTVLNRNQEKGETEMTLRLTRKVQQGVVVNPKGQKEKTLVIRVLDMVPNTVGLGFDGEDYEVVRTEIYKGGNDTDDYSNSS